MGGHISYSQYLMSPAAHIKEAEKYADTADTDRYDADEPFRLRMAVLAVAHANIARAQMQGAQRI